MSSSCCIDTNILIRHVIDNDNRFIQILKEHTKIVIAIPMMIETVFVLEKVYGVEREKVKDYLGRVLSNSSVSTQKEFFKDILDQYTNYPSLSIYDCYLLQFSLDKKMNLMTFDKKLHKAFDKQSQQ